MNISLKQMKTSESADQVDRQESSLLSSTEDTWFSRSIHRQHIIQVLLLSYLARLRCGPVAARFAISEAPQVYYTWTNPP